MRMNFWKLISSKANQQYSIYRRIFWTGCFEEDGSIPSTTLAVLDEWNSTNLQTIQGCDFIETGVEILQEKLSKNEKQNQHSLKQWHVIETKEAITSCFECLVVKLNHLTLPCNLYHPVASVHWSWLSVSSVLSYKSRAAVDSVRFREDSKPERKSIQNS